MKPYWMNKCYQSLYAYRFEVYLTSLLATLFGSLVTPKELHETYFLPILFLSNLLAGTLVISKNRKLLYLFIALFVYSFFSFGLDFFDKVDGVGFSGYSRLAIYFIFYFIVTSQIVKQLWQVESDEMNVILGLMSGYISIGILGFFLFLTIELMSPGSFEGIHTNPTSRTDSLIYFSYITLLTIGYGEIYPVTAIAQRAAVLIGLLGQFYLVIIMAVAIEKYIRFKR